MSIELYEEALEAPDPAGMVVRFDDGSQEALEVGRWRAEPDRADRSLLVRIDGPVLDVGCGPGRMVAALSACGIVAVGLDLSAAAVRLARHRGAMAVRGDVLGGIPLPGLWRQILLVDGNIGIGGHPAALLLLLRGGLARGGTILVEVSPPHAVSATLRARLEAGDRTPGAWFPWARVSAADLSVLAGSAGLTVAGRWEVDNRWFAALTR